MTNDISPSAAVKPYWRTCPCPTCVSTREADALAARLGMAGPTIDPDTIHWSQVGPYHVPLPTEGPAEAEAGGPSDADEMARLETVPAWFLEDAPYEWELSPHEQAMEILGERAWDRAIREMEDDEADREYDRLIDTLGGFPAGW